MTEKLYYRDAGQLTFTTRLREQRETARGPVVRLEATAFYPTSGGQPHDLGTLNGVAVLDVWNDDQGEIWHLLTAPLDIPQVTGHVDAERRRDHRQQHSGQHLLSAACRRLLGAATIGFHLGSESSTIDLDLPQLQWEEAFHLEDEVNRLIWENRAVSARFVSDAELEALALRKEPQVEGAVRIVSVEGYDATPCGGTHVARTGEIGLLKITGLERYKGGTRVTFRCGERALTDYRRGLRLLQTLSTELTVGQEELPAAVARLQEEARTTRHALHQAQDALLAAEATKIWNAAPPEKAEVRILRRHWPQRDFGEVQGLARRLRERPRTVVLFATGAEEGVRFVCARSDDLPEVDAEQLLRRLAAPLDGRGGGSPALAQGGAPPTSHENVADALKGITVHPKLTTDG